MSRIVMILFLTLATTAVARAQGDPIDGTNQRPCIIDSVPATQGTQTFFLNDSTKLIVNDQTTPGGYWLIGGDQLTVSVQRGYPRYYIVCPRIGSDVLFSVPDDIIRKSLQHEMDDYLNRLSVYGGRQIDRLMTVVDSFENVNDRVPMSVEAESLLGTPNTTRTGEWGRAGRVTYLYYDSLSYHLHFWDLDGSHMLASGGSTDWGDHPDSEAIEWSADRIPDGHISWAMFHDENPQWSVDMVITMMEEITRRRQFCSYVVRDAPGLIALEPVVVQAVECSTYSPEQRSRAKAAIDGFIGVLRDEKLRHRLQVYELKNWP